MQESNPVQARYEHLQAKIASNPANQLAALRNAERDQTKRVLSDNRQAHSTEARRREGLEKARETRRLQTLRKKPDLTKKEEQELKRLEYALTQQEELENETKNDG